MKANNVVLSFTLLVLFLSLTIVSADGGFIKPANIDTDIKEPEQKGIIVHSENTEKLILQVSYETEVEEFAWIVPTPSYPEVDKSNSLYFTELSFLTKPIHHKAPDLFLPLASPMMSKGTDSMNRLFGESEVSLHDRQWMDVYTIEIISSTDSDALYDWLNENGFSLSPKVKGALDPYVEKEWYFVIMKFNPKYKIYEFIEDVKIIDSEIISYQDGLSVLSDYIIELSKTETGYYNTLLPKLTYTSVKSSNSYNPGNNPELPFVDSTAYNNYKKILNTGGEEAFKERLEKDIKTIFSRTVDSRNSKSGILNPLEITFKTEEVVYPLKVSSMNSGPSEILIYILTDHKTKIENYDVFELEYAKEITFEDIEIYKNLKDLFDNRYFVTKHRAKLFPAEMTHDLIISNAINDKEFILHTYEDDYILNWFLFILVLIIYLGVVYVLSLLVCLVFRLINNLFFKKSNNSKLYVPFKRVFVQAFFFPIFFVPSYIMVALISGIFIQNSYGLVNDYWAILFSIMALVAIVLTYLVTFLLALLFNLVFKRKKGKKLPVTPSKPIQNK